MTYKYLSLYCIPLTFSLGNYIILVVHCFFNIPMPFLGGWTAPHGKYFGTKNLMAVIVQQNWKKNEKKTTYSICEYWWELAWKPQTPGSPLDHGPSWSIFTLEHHGIVDFCFPYTKVIAILPFGRRPQGYHASQRPILVINIQINFYGDFGSWVVGGRGGNTTIPPEFFLKVLCD